MEGPAVAGRFGWPEPPRVAGPGEPGEGVKGGGVLRGPGPAFTPGAKPLIDTEYSV